MRAGIVADCDSPAPPLWRRRFGRPAILVLVVLLQVFGPLGVALDVGGEAVGLGTALHSSRPAFAGEAVTVTAIDSKVLRGELQRITATAVTLKSSNQEPESIECDRIVSLQFEASTPRTAPVARLGTVDGSEIAVESVLFDGDQLTATPRRQKPLKIAADAILWLRFSAASPQTDPTWLGLLGERPRTDLLVIRREQGKLDQLSGVIESVSTDRVQFTLDGSTIEAPIERLEGLVFASPREGVRAGLAVRDVFGSFWRPQRVTLDAEAVDLNLTLPGGQVHRIPRSQVRSIQWSGAVVNLVDLEPVETRFRPYLETSNQAYLKRASRWFGPQTSRGGDPDVADDSRSVRSKSRRTSDTITLYASSEVTYRIESEMRRFTGSVRRKSGPRIAGNVEVKFRLDQETVWEHTLTDGQALGFDLGVEAARRLTIEVLAGDDGDLGDAVELKQPRLTK